ncbi:hypothetical protein LBMAG49_16300 [Planctomycetota bacterium]|nr:hypothetical protein LBMAG49_16300 [Planctomycetota bacterium]
MQQRPDLTLNSEVLLSYGMQALVCLISAWLLAYFSRKQPKLHLRWWSISWLLFFGYLVTAAIAMSVTSKLPPNDWRRLTVSSASLIAGLLQPFFIALGTFNNTRQRQMSARTRSQTIVLLTMVAILIAIFSSLCPYRLAVRLGTRSLFAGIVLLVTAVHLLQTRQSSASVGRAILGWSMLVYGIEQLQMLAVSIWQQTYGMDSWEQALGSYFLYPYYLGFFDVMLQVVMGVGMFTWHLESERTRTEDALLSLATSKEGLRQAQKMEVIGRLAGGVAHDFNNLLTVMYGATEALKPMHDKGSEGNDYIQDIEDALHRAKGLTSQLLALSRKQLVSVTQIDLSLQVREHEKMLSRLLGTDIVLRTKIIAGAHYVSADPGQISQLLMNLAANARDAMPQGGELVVAVDQLAIEGAEAQRLDLAPGTYELIRFSDTGTGMSDKVKAQIFEPFFTTKPTGKGTGLGLATVKGLVLAANGAIEVESAIGQGTTIKVYWPYENQSGLIPAKTTQTAPNSKQRLKILVTEDDQPIRDMLVRALEKQGFLVHPAKDGAQGLLVLRAEGPFSMLITDVIMPGIDGSELIAASRLLYPLMPILAISGYTGDLSSRTIPTDVAWLQKPFTAADLIAMIEKTLQKHATDPNH